MGREQGSATLLGLIVMMVLSLLGTTLLMLSRTNLQIAANQRDGIAAQYLAEAGVQHAIAKLKTDLDFVNKTKTTNQIITSLPMGSVPTKGTYAIQTGPDPMVANPNIRLLIATGVVNQAKRQVTAQITLPIQLGEVDSWVVIWNY